MARHLILTVHGIGEQKPGETVDQVVGAATTWFDGKPRPPVQIERDMIELAENNFDGTTRNVRLFKVHTRNVRKLYNQADEAMFAEVFWADRSPAPKGAFKTVLDLIWVVLALGYLAMDNVEQTHRRKGIERGKAKERTTLAALLVHGFTWVFFGGVAAINAFLLLGAAAMMIDQLSGDAFRGKAAYVCALLGVYGAATAFGVRQWNRAPTYLRRVFWRGTAIVGTAAISALISGPLVLEWWDCAKCIATTNEGVLPSEYSALGQYVAFQILALGAAWALLVFSTLVLYMTSLLPLGIDDELSEHRRIYPSICSGMLAFWLFFMSGFWLGLEKIVGSVNMLSDGALTAVLGNQLGKSIGTLGAAFVLIAALVLCGGCIFAIRKIRRKKLHEASSLTNRAVLNRWAQIVFLLGAVVMSVAVYQQVGNHFSGGNPFCPIEKTNQGELENCSVAGAFLKFLESHQGAIALIALTVAAMLYRFSYIVSAGLGVGRDIVTYAIRKRCYLAKELPARQANYPDRTAINERFYRTLYYALSVFSADHITVISHSQGTVIATQMLADPRVQRRIKGRPVTLITMGCPVTHIYQRYFPEMFTVDSGALNAAWFNIFREDDFVGTRIDGGLIDERRDMPVNPGGHTGYFTDYEVWQILCGDQIGFDLFNPKICAP
ncbi:hypothetical protein [Shimia abyssi]|uniref:Uncharacterized protein n=1 Tax=Shimia abyssi TaxID=1662395 RepID=A0A2P8FBK7_9RHOB|nr:hypothetical protein [Shimia abyssi]PSL19099.1 hypothetical protein CLV88_10742 [Shimia abyssi]